VKVSATTVGRESEPVVIIDDFAEDYAALREAAAASDFGSARHFYPGLRAALPPDYLDRQLPLIQQAMAEHIQPCRRVEVIDASFSLVTTARDELDPRQRVPHVDAYGRERIALVHFLSDHPDGTAFYRHRLSGFETITEARAPSFFPALEAQLSNPPEGYIAGDTALFEQTLAIPAKPNRALLYRSYVLHSGAITHDLNLSANPLVGRLTVTGFFAIE
jgi:hypothetical protein